LKRFIRKAADHGEPPSACSAARLVHRLDYVRLCGLVAGSMTDPPALAFGNALLGGDAASTIYAAVYPLTMLLRVVTAQILALATVGGG
jgi:uncharacterized transporter YbjL